MFHQAFKKLDSVRKTGTNNFSRLFQCLKIVAKALYFIFIPLLKTSENQRFSGVFRGYRKGG